MIRFINLANENTIIFVSLFSQKSRPFLWGFRAPNDPAIRRITIPIHRSVECLFERGIVRLAAFKIEGDGIKLFLSHLARIPLKQGWLKLLAYSGR